MGVHLRALFMDRWWQHRDATGRLVPGTLADADEICMIAKAIAKGGGGAFQMHNDFKSFDDIPEEQVSVCCLLSCLLLSDRLWSR